jgi:transposase-like protein
MTIWAMPGTTRESRDGGNSRTGHQAKTVLTEARLVEISVPRDRDS